jgi:hypothetical protein
MFGTSRRQEIALSEDGLVTGAYSGVTGAGRGNDVSNAGSTVGLDKRASWAAHRCVKTRAAIKKKRTDGNLVGFTMHKF